ncbi:MAG: nucleoside monophosphate kinase [Verrucomicrobiae bacterium]|nr:nucleoside monophosphate kinase [Verrucomicrobiae bacterium]
MATKYKTILLFGPPGCGKGTQGKVLGQLPNFLHCSSGDLFRGLDKQSELGKVFAEYSSKGLLVPDDFTVRLWQDHMERLVQAKKFDPQAGRLILDGIPRNVAQAKMMEDKIEPVQLFNLVTPDPQLLIQRLKRRALIEGRKDDANEDTIRRRLEVYEKETRPMLDFYQKVRVDIDGTTTPIQVLKDVLKYF